MSTAYPWTQNCEPVDCWNLHPQVTLAGMFDALGILTLAYTFYAIVRGEVYAKAGWRGRLVARPDSPHYFWIVIAIYAALGVALIVVF